jgi:hypothetical protein
MSHTVQLAICEGGDSKEWCAVGEGSVDDMNMVKVHICEVGPTAVFRKLIRVV